MRRSASRFCAPLLGVSSSATPAPTAAPAAISPTPVMMREKVLGRRWRFIAPSAHCIGIDGFIAEVSAFTEVAVAMTLPIVDILSAKLFTGAECMIFDALRDTSLPTLRVVSRVVDAMSDRLDFML